MLRQGSEFLRQGATAFAEDRAIPAIEQATGKQVDPRVAGIYGGAVGAVPGILTEEALTLGAGTAVRGLRSINRVGPPPTLNFGLAGATNTGSVVRQQMDEFTPPTVMEAVTTTNKEVLGNVRGGIKTGDDLMTPEYGKRLIERAAEIEARQGSIESLDESIKALTELRSDPKNLEKYISTASDYVKSKWSETGGDVDYIIKRLKAIKKKTQPALSQAQSNVAPFAKEGDFQRWYDTTAGRAVKTAEEKAQAIKVALEQHHLFPKGISAAYFAKMDQLIAAGKAQPDELIAMFEYAVNKGKTPGDYKVNLKNMQKPPHNEMHTVLRDQGDELPKGRYEQSLKDVDNVDDLMARWVDILNDEVGYNIDTAEIWEDMGKLIADTQK